jgi:hypothetical protein
MILQHSFCVCRSELAENQARSRRAVDEQLAAAAAVSSRVSDLWRRRVRGPPQGGPTSLFGRQHSLHYCSKSKTNLERFQAFNPISSFFFSLSEYGAASTACQASKSAAERICVSILRKSGGETGSCSLRATTPTSAGARAQTQPPSRRVDLFTPR